MRKTLTLSTIILVILGGFFYNQRSQIRDLVFQYQKASLPEAISYTNYGVEDPLPPPKAGGGVGKDPVEDGSLGKRKEAWPSEINLAVPFTSQAPHANWELPYKEACEEASLLMIARYKKGEPITSPEDADQEIWQLINFQNELFGDYKDTTAEQTAQIAREYYGFRNTEVMYDFSLDDIKEALAAGNPVMIPAAGRQLPNPYFRTPGPIYHMLVIRGYTKDKFITNDPGTKRGEEFVYRYNDLLNAVHDWNGGEVNTGQKVMIVVR